MHYKTAKMYRKKQRGGYDNVNQPFYPQNYKTAPILYKAGKRKTRSKKAGRVLVGNGKRKTRSKKAGSVLGNLAVPASLFLANRYYKKRTNKALFSKKK